MRIFAFADEASPSIDLQIKAMQRNQLNGLEIRNVDGQNVVAISNEKAKEVRKKMDDAGLTVWSIGSPIGKIGIQDAFEPHLDALRHTLEVADILGADKIRMFSFYLPEGADPAQYRGEVMDRLNAMAEAAAGTRILFCHENEKGIYGDNAARCLDILQQIPTIRNIFDPANYVQCGQETLSAWDMLGKYTEYMHIKDALENGHVVPAGCGIGNVPAILKQFIAQGGDAVTIEPHLTVFDGLSGLERPGDKQSVQNDYSYPTADAAFDAACRALRNLL